MFFFVNILAMLIIYHSWRFSVKKIRSVSSFLTYVNTMPCIIQHAVLANLNYGYMFQLILANSTVVRATASLCGARGKPPKNSKLSPVSRAP